MRPQHLFTVFALGLGLTLALLAGLHTAQAAPAATDRFVKPDGTGTTCSRFQPCTIQTALAQAGEGDTLYAARGDYTGKGTDVISVTKSITLYGGWDGAVFGPIERDPARYPSVLDGEGKRRVIRISGNITPALDGFTIANGNATGLVADCEASMPDGCGGGIFVDQAHPLIVNNIITNNVAAITTAGLPTGTTGYGGGLYLEYAMRAVISGNLIISNVASLAYCGEGGGIYLYPYGNVSGMQVQFNQVLSNTATATNDGCAWGGGIAGGPNGVLIQGNSVIGNRANSDGGGYGAGLYHWFGSATYLNNLVSRNLGIDSQTVYLGYSRSHFEGNRVVDNATSQGIRLINGSGGGPTLVNNVVARSGDRAFVANGGVSAPLTVTLLHNTLVGSGTGYGVYVETGYVTLFLTNTIVASTTWGITNTAPASSTVMADHTLFWANTYAGIRGISPVDGNPAFAADGYHLIFGSQAVDAGVCTWVTADIDGDPRPIGPACDIGADEARWLYVYLPLVVRDY